MTFESDKTFGTVISKLINKTDLTREEAKDAFSIVLKNETTEMQQGAFLAALVAKGETKEEVAAGWEAIYDLDTEKVTLEASSQLVENSGTGMDTFKTFNISTAASLIAASDGIPMARHGARAITSICGTVDMVEALGVDVECDAQMVADSIQKAGIGLFNGMSPKIHPLALGRILSSIFFGSTLNIAASLANPALPKLAVRGVYSKALIRPVAEVMKEIGYQRAIVLYGSINDSGKGMDEVSICGKTYCAELFENGEISEYSIDPTDFDLNIFPPETIAPSSSIAEETKKFVTLLKGMEEGPREIAAYLNAGLIFYITGKADTIKEGVQKAKSILFSGAPYQTLEKWVACQNQNPEAGLKKLAEID